MFYANEFWGLSCSCRGEQPALLHGKEGKTLVNIPTCLESQHKSMDGDEGFDRKT